MPYKDPEKRNAWQKAYRAKHPEATRKYNREYQRHRRATNPEYRERVRAQNRIRALQYYHRNKDKAEFKRKRLERTFVAYWIDPEKYREKNRKEYFRNNGHERQRQNNRRYIQEFRLEQSSLFYANLIEELSITLSPRRSSEERNDLATVMAEEIAGRLLKPGCKRTPTRRNFDD